MKQIEIDLCAIMTACSLAEKLLLLSQTQLVTEYGWASDTRLNGTAQWLNNLQTVINKYERHSETNADTLISYIFKDVSIYLPTY